MGTKLFVGGLPWSMKSDDLKQAFAVHGEVVEAKVVEDRQTGRSRGFGFVSFATEAQAQSALELNGKELGGRTIKVDMARDREDRGGGRDQGQGF